MILLGKVDNYYNYFRFASHLNKCTTTYNLSLSLYRNELAYEKINNLQTLNKPLLKNFNSQVSLLALPLYSKTSNNFLLYSMIFNMSTYSSIFSLYKISTQYFFELDIMRGYNNLNFYYAKVYNH